MNTISNSELHLPYKRLIATYELVTLGADLTKDSLHHCRPAQVVSL